MAAMTYSERHGDTLMAFCQPVAVAQTPAEQPVAMQVDLPAFVPDAPPGGGGSGSGSGH
jgi:hypothetical protein